MLAFNKDDCRNLEISGAREWLVVNGIGGYASSTIASMNTRRYHGLLVAATAPPLGRMVLLSQLEDALIVDGVRFNFSTNLYAGSIVHPAGYLNLTDFRLDPFPCFTYAHDDWQMKKSIFMVQGENTTVVEYVFITRRFDRSVQLEIRPLIAFRDYHSLTHENDALDCFVKQTPGCIEMRPYQEMPSCFLGHDSAAVDLEAYWYKDFQYDEERRRGLDYIEDLYSPLVSSRFPEMKAEFAKGGHI